MTALAEVIAAMAPGDDGWRATVPDDWLQGRTAYGGLSSALALHAAKASEPDLPPLRSATVAFVGPLAGALTIAARRLRRGRNAAFVEVTITSDAGLGLSATFVFMAELPSAIAYDAATRPARTPPAADATLYTGPAGYFTGNFNFLDLKDGVGPAEWLRWGRLVERAGLDPEVALIAVADALPPAAFKLFGRTPAPVSSLTWMLNVLTPRPETRDGWWLMHAVTDRAAGGGSSQRMTIRDADGTPVVEAMQAVAIFG